MGLLSGLSSLGLGKLEEAEIFSSEEETEAAKPEEKPVKAEPAFDETSVLFDKNCVCPACGGSFTYRAVRTGKARLIGQDMDLRPRYDKFDPAKYDVIICTNCGYGVLTRYLSPLPQAQVKLLKDNICGKVKGLANKPVYTYDDAVQRYQVALASTIVKRGRDSEKAYICLKMGWAIRGKAEELPKDTPNYDTIMSELRDDENEALQNAFEGFITARQKETFPIAGMDETTVDYLLAALAARFKHYDISQKLIGTIITSKTANSRIKDRARQLKDQIKADMELQGQS